MPLTPNAFDTIMGVIMSTGPGAGFPSYPDSNFVPVPLGRSSELLTGNVHGKNFTSAYRGNLFIASTAVAGTAIPINTTTAPTFILWNPASSNRYIVPIAYYAGFASGTGVAGAIGYQILQNAGGAATGTTTNITAFTDVAAQVVCGNVGLTTPKARFAVAATIVTTSNTQFFRSSGLSQGAPITTTASYWVLQDTSFEGQLLLPPGNALYTVANAAIAEVTMQSIVWEEVIYP